MSYISKKGSRKGGQACLENFGRRHEAFGWLGPFSGAIDTMVSGALGGAY